MKFSYSLHGDMIMHTLYRLAVVQTLGGFFAQIVKLSYSPDTGRILCTNCKDEL